MHAVCMSHKTCKEAVPNPCVLHKSCISYKHSCYKHQTVYVHCIHTDHGVSVAMLLTWFPFLYFEMTFRFNYVPQYLLNISRPFAAHWYVCCVYIYISMYNDYNNCMPTVLTQRPVLER